MNKLNRKQISRSKLGFTLVEVMIAVSIMGTLAVFLAKYTQQQVKTQKFSTSRIALTTLNTEITNLLTTRNHCKSTFINLPISFTNPVIDSGLTSLKRYYSEIPADGSNPAIPSKTTNKYPINTKFNNNIQVLSYAVSGSTSATSENYIDPATGKGEANLEVKYRLDSKTVRTKKIKLSVDTTGTPDYHITTCAAMAQEIRNYVEGDFTVKGNLYLGDGIVFNYDENTDEETCGPETTGGDPKGSGKVRFDRENNQLTFCDGYKWWPVSSPYESPAIGARAYRDIAPSETGGILTGRCSTNFALSGITGRGGWALDQLSLHCKHQNGAPQAAMTIGSPGGGSSFGNSNACPTGYFYSKVAVRTNTGEDRFGGYKITGLKLWCSNMDNPSDIVEPASTRWIGKEFSNSFWKTFQCPRGSFISEFTIEQNRESNTTTLNTDCKGCVANITFVCKQFNNANTVTSEPM